MIVSWSSRRSRLGRRMTTSKPSVRSRVSVSTCEFLTAAMLDTHEKLLDGVFIGPYDLSLSLGYPPPNPDPHPKVEEAIQRILKAAHNAGKKWLGLLFH